VKIVEVVSFTEAIPLSRPYTIATRSIESVALTFVCIRTQSGLEGVGAASPSAGVTGETSATCAQAAGAADSLLRGRDARHLGALCRELEALQATPAARAALDMALYDLFCKHLGIAVVDFLGRCHQELPTSITIGIKSTAEALEEAAEYVGRGFRRIKVKLGHDYEADIERLTRLRESLASDVALRVDANQGYSVEQVVGFEHVVRTLGIELVEQPLPAAAVDALGSLPESLREVIAADESLVNEADARRLAGPPSACGIFNIKLMKCGGITAAQTIARIGQASGRRLMWGCNDESALSIAAALHAAYAARATRFLDLDGSLDLARDPAEGGFVIRDGMMRLADGPGLGTRLRRW
jgi:L-Ala-D/L-Glu epimerase